MKKILFLITFALLVRIQSFSQATSMTVDCQTPGWLSNMINYEDQQTVYNLTIIGYLNGTNIKFIRELNKNRNLHGVINLENANFVTGGVAYYSNYYTKDNTFTNFMFAYLNSMQKVILPKSLNSSEGGQQFCQTSLDTLIINGSMESISVGHCRNSQFWKRLTFCHD